MGNVPKTPASGTPHSDFVRVKKSEVCEGERRGLSGTREKQLIAAARSGDETAFDTLFKSNLGAIRAAGSSILGTDDLDDLTQEVSILAWKGLETFREESTFRTWVTSIARRRCFALLKQRKAQVPDSRHEDRAREDR